MGELSIEEKARRYDEALDEAKAIHKAIRKDLKPVIEQIFLELKESEDDRIRKALISILKSDFEKDTAIYDINVGDIIAWLEKQCEKSLFNWHNINDEPEEMRELLCEWESSDATWHDVAFYHSDRTFWNGTQQVENVVKWCYIDDLLEKQDSQKTNNAEPKFKVKDWVICIKNFSTPGFDFKSGEVFRCTGINEIGLCGMTASNLDNFRLWTIQDAKDGDVLAASSFSSDCIFIFDRLDKWKFDEPDGERAVATGHCCLTLSADNMEFGIQGPDCIEVDTVKPATKIQRDLLFQKMHEADYEWDDEKKELKKIEQKTAWSEEDENEFKWICVRLQEHHMSLEYTERVRKAMSWIKAFKERCTWKPSDEQINGIECAIKTLQHQLNVGDKRLNSLYNDLKKLK